jgi:hypothetical protein
MRCLVEWASSKLRLADCLAPSGTKPSFLRPRIISRVGIGRNCCERLACAVTAKIEGAPRLHFRLRQGMGLVEASAFTVDAHDLSP